jgi:hypothetical protein
MNFLRALLISIIALFSINLMEAYIPSVYNSLDFKVEAEVQRIHKDKIFFAPKEFKLNFPYAFLMHDMVIKGEHEKGRLYKEEYLYSLKDIFKGTHYIIVFETDKKDPSGLRLNPMTVEEFKKTYKDAYEKNEKEITEVIKKEKESEAEEAAAAQETQAAEGKKE